MTTSTPVYAARTLIASQSVAAGDTVRGTLDLRGKYGATVTVKITNGATGPSLQAVAKLLIAHTDGATPAAAAAGADWKTYYLMGGGGVNVNNVSEFCVPVQGVAHLQVEVGGHTGQAVTIEAYATEFSSVASA